MDNLEQKQLIDVLRAKEEYLRALAIYLLVRIRIDGERVLDLSSIMLNTSKDHLLAELEKYFSEQEAVAIKNAIDELYSFGLAFLAADVFFEDSFGAAAKIEFQELVAKVKAHNDELFGWAWAALRKNPVISKKLKKIEEGKGYRDDAVDVSQIVEILRDNLSYFEGSKFITLDYLNEAAEDALRLITLLDNREDQKKNTDAADLRVRAYSAWYHKYMHIRAAGLYILRDKKDLKLKKLLPNVSSVRSKKKPKINPPEEPYLDFLE